MRYLLDHKQIGQLLIAYQGGDYQAFTAFYRATRDLVFSYLLSRLKSRSAAEDAFQETYFRIHRHILSFKAQEPALPWIMTIAKRCMIDYAKKNFRVSLTNLDVVDAKNSSSEDQIIARNYLEKVARELDGEELELFKSRLINDLDYEEIAATMDISEDNARQKVSRLLRKLKRPAWNL